ncbi:MAG: hypothetical protein HGA19_06695 [Oscillochloris sp.]|nr:hypothetical protein [Oscillochloris sp.]
MIARRRFTLLLLLGIVLLYACQSSEGSSILGSSSENTASTAVEHTVSAVAGNTVPPANVHLLMGNPSGAVSDAGQLHNYLIVRDQYALSYDRDRGIPNWVSWHLQDSDLGPAQRYSGPFVTDTSLPSAWYQVKHSDYTSSGYDRGHMTPSADRTASDADNRTTFILTNVLPQAPENNQGLWKDLEDHARDVVNQGNEIYTIAGGSGTLGTLADKKLTIPAAVWKVMLVLPAAKGDDLARVTDQTQVIAIWTPNDATVQGADWESYQTSVACIQERTGLDLFAALDDAVEASLEGASCAGGPPVRQTVTAASTAPSQPTSLSPSFNDCAEDSNADLAPNYPVVITAIDKSAETVTLRNVSDSSVSLDGWVMCSVRGSQQHPVAGSLAAGKTKVFSGSTGNIWSNASSDPGALYDADGRLVSYWPD